MKSKRYLGIDWGHRRLGLAYADEDLQIVFPLPSLSVQNEKQALDELQKLMGLKRIDYVVIGYPLHMDGSEGERTRVVACFANRLQELTKVPYSLSDERLTTYEAIQSVSLHRKKQTLKDAQKDRQSGKVDSRAAVIILQDYLNERATFSNEP